MRNFILKIHLYGGLLCSPYLIIFGLSSLQFNHHFVQPNDDEVTWSQKHRLGWLMLFVGYGYTIATVLYLAHAP